MSSPLEKQIGYVFKDPALLTLALTHRSVLGAHNERLEFLGDSILSAVISQALYKQFPKATEGQLSRLRSSLVKGPTLATLAQSFALGESLILGIGELKNGGHRRQSILENALEALIGAIYLDSDFEQVKTIVLIWFAPYLEKIQLSDNVRDPKSRLQEYLQGKALSLPMYEIIDMKGKEHDRIFFVRCTVPDLSLEAEAQGLSRKHAEQHAAELILKKMEEK